MKQTYYIVVYCPDGDASRCWPCEDAIFTDRLQAEGDLRDWTRVAIEAEYYQLVDLELTEAEAEAIKRSGGDPIP